MRVETDAAPGSVPLTPEATIGPFYPAALVADLPPRPERARDLLGAGLDGQLIQVTLRVRDCEGRPVAGAVVESWQADAQGRYRAAGDSALGEVASGFDGFARLATDASGAARLYTVKPGAHGVPGRSRRRAPHLRLTLLAAGIERLATQLFFEDEGANANDPLLVSMTDVAARSRLLLRRVPADDREQGRILAYELTLVLRGGDETPFFTEGPS